MNRRNFVKKSLLGTSVLSLGINSSSAGGNTKQPKSISTPLSETTNDITNVIPDLKAVITHPVTIESINLIKVGKDFLVVTRSTDGVVGVCQSNSRLNNMTTLFKNQAASFFISKDARDIEAMLEQVYVYRRNYKYAGMPLWNCIAHVEISILDLLGRVAKKPVFALLGKQLRKKIPIYLSSTERDTSAQEEVEWVGERIKQTNSRAAKIKIGARMSNNADMYPGRSEDLVKLARKTWGDDFELYVDSNGSYDVAKAIEMGRFLERYNVAFYEEPVPWEDFYGTKLVADALDMVVAGGEQDSSMPKWKWFIDNNAFALLQPDIMYNGGMIRTVKVAQMARQAGIDVTLHSPKNNALAAYMLHFATITENLGPYQEFRAKLSKADQSYYTPNLVVENGEVAVPDGHGFGINYDPDILKIGM